MLWAASILSFVAGMPELGWAIAAVVVVNGLFAFLQEARAERAPAKLRELLPNRIQVRRRGHARGAAFVIPGVLAVDALHKWSRHRLGRGLTHPVLPHH